MGGFGKAVQVFGGGAKFEKILNEINQEVGV